MKIICDCGNIMTLIPNNTIDDKNRKILYHPNYSGEEIEIYEFEKDEHTIGFYCNGCQNLYVYDVKHRD